MNDYSYHTVSSIINAFEKKSEFSLQLNQTTIFNGGGGGGDIVSPLSVQMVFLPYNGPGWGHLSHTDTFLVLFRGTRVNP